MHVLVTGAGGFSGAEVVRELLARGHRVTAVVRSRRGRLQEKGGPAGKLTILAGDLSSDLVLPSEIDAIVHAAGCSPGPGVTAEEIVRDNVLATQQLVSHARNTGVRKLVLFSTLSVYGRISAPVVDETTPIHGPDIYGRTKREAEELVAAENTFGSLALRLPGIIGRGSVRNWLTRVLAAAREGRDVTVFNPATPFNNAVHVADLTRFVAGWLERDEQRADVVTLGAAGEIAVGDAVQLLVDALGGRSRIRRELSVTPGFVVSSRRARERYGYEAMDIKDMLLQFAAENAAS